MQIAWLLSLAAGVTALNVSITNNLVGVTTVRVTGAGLRVAATLGADSSLLGVEIDNAHLLTARNLGGATIGLAWTGGMCDALGRSSAVGARRTVCVRERGAPPLSKEYSLH